MFYTYDAAGNLIQTIDNKGQVIVYTYDGTNRMLTEDYLDSNNISPDVSYHYDTPSPDYPYARNTRGRLAWIEDLSGAMFFSYDERGNSEWTARRIINDDLVQDFMFINEYDAMGRVVSATFPDGDKIEYSYNNRSLLESIPGILNSIDYNPSGKVRSLSYANGLTTNYSYDPRDRLIRLVTDYTTPTGNPIQDLSYTLDPISNITQIKDNRNISPTSPENATQSFEYDDLYRLTLAQGPGYGAIAFQYDKIGNMIFKGSPPAPDPQHINDPLVNLGHIENGGSGGTSGRGVKMPGDPPGPHAITGTESGMSFDYDDNGNMINHNGDIYEWDFEDRLLRTTTSNTTATYIYDHDDNRVIKKSRSNGAEHTVYYVSKGFEIRDGKIVKYVFDDKRRVARIEGRLSQEGDIGLQVLNLRQGWNFISFDVEPDDPSISAVLAPIEGKYKGIWTFDALSLTYAGHVPSEGINDLTEIHAQQGYIIYMTEPAFLVVTGTRTAHDISLQPGWNFIPCPTDCPMDIEEALSPIAGQYEAVWSYDPEKQRWQKYISLQKPFLNDLRNMTPGKAYWIKMSVASLLPYQHKEAKIYFYHPDHLGSSSVVTDMSGEVVERTEFYPYGRPRYSRHDPFDSAYKYTGKELDKETGLMYYGARYYDAVIGRFVSVDPLIGSASGASDMFSHQAYTYAALNPLKFLDPTGRAICTACNTDENRAHVKKAVKHHKRRKRRHRRRRVRRGRVDFRKPPPVIGRRLGTTPQGQPIVPLSLPGEYPKLKEIQETFEAYYGKKVSLWRNPGGGWSIHEAGKDGKLLGIIYGTDDPSVEPEMETAAKSIGVFGEGMKELLGYILSGIPGSESVVKKLSETDIWIFDVKTGTAIRKPKQPGWGTIALKETIKELGGRLLSKGISKITKWFGFSETAEKAADIIAHQEYEGQFEDQE